MPVTSHGDQACALTTDLTLRVDPPSAAKFPRAAEDPDVQAGRARFVVLTPRAPVPLSSRTLRPGCCRRNAALAVRRLDRQVMAMQAIGNSAGAVQWGDVPTWVSAAGTVMALIFAAVAAVMAKRVYTIESRRDQQNEIDRRERDEQKRAEQASRVSAWYAAEKAESGELTWGAVIRNASELPVYDVNVEYYFLKDQHSQMRVADGPVRFFGPGGTYPLAPHRTCCAGSTQPSMATSPLRSRSEMPPGSDGVAESMEFSADHRDPCHRHTNSNYPVIGQGNDATWLLNREVAMDPVPRVALRPDPRDPCMRVRSGRPPSRPRPGRR